MTHADAPAQAGNDTPVSIVDTEWLAARISDDSIHIVDSQRRSVWTPRDRRSRRALRSTAAPSCTARLLGINGAAFRKAARERVGIDSGE